MLDLKRDANGVLSYTVAVRSLDGTGGPSTHGVDLGDGFVTTGGKPTGRGVTCTFDLTNTGTWSAGGQQHPENVNQYLKSDVYRLSADIGQVGWRVELPNALAAVGFGKMTKVKVSVGATADAAPRGFVKLTATSVSDPTKTVTRACHVEKA